MRPYCIYLTASSESMSGGGGGGDPAVSSSSAQTPSGASSYVNPLMKVVSDTINARHQHSEAVHHQQQQNVQFTEFSHGTMAFTL